MNATKGIADDGLPLPSFADPCEIVVSALSTYKPALRINVSEYAAKHRFLNNSGGGFVGKWSHDEAPYLVGPMEALTDIRYLTTAIIGPARSGKTTVGQNWLLQSVAIDPADFLMVAQTDDMIESYVKREIDTLIDMHAVMRGKLGKRAKDRSLHFKRFEGMFAEFVSASYSNLINKTVPRGIVTELDACPIHDQGDVFTLIDIRRQTFGKESMILVESHPDLAQGVDPSRWNAGIMKLYRDSDRHTWWWPCPECNAYSSPTPGTARSMTLHYDEEASLDEIADSARLLCPCCGALIEDSMRRSMNVDGKWVASGQSISEEGVISGEPVKSTTAGFWITGLMSPFLMSGIGGLARDYVAAKRHFEMTGEDHSLKAVTVKKLGIPYQSPSSARNIDAEVVAARTEPNLRLGFVPDGVRFLTASADIQINRFEWLVRGWGVGAESWVVDRQVMMADTAQDASAWAEMVSRLTGTIYPLASDSSRGMKVLAACYDSGGSDGVTLQAYEAWRKARAQRLVRNFGISDGRDLWTLLPVKGASSLNAPLLRVSYPDSQRKDRFTRSRGDLPLGIFSPSSFKDILGTELMIGEPGPNYVHIPRELAEMASPTFCEQIAAEERLASGRWVRKQGNPPNEGLDLMVMTEVMATLFGLRRLNWDAPPSWARPHADNTMIVPYEGDTSKPSARTSAEGRTVAQPRGILPGSDLSWITQIAKTIGSTRKASSNGW